MFGHSYFVFFLGFVCLYHWMWREENLLRLFYWIGYLGHRFWSFVDRKKPQKRGLTALFIASDFGLPLGNRDMLLCYFLETNKTMLPPNLSRHHKYKKMLIHAPPHFLVGGEFPYRLIISTASESWCSFLVHLYPDLCWR